MTRSAGVSRKRVLIVSWHYPPSPAIGARRIGQLVQGLPNHGWDVQVLGPRARDGTSPAGHVIATPRARPSEWIRALLPVDDRPLFEQVTGAASQRPEAGDTQWRAKVVREARSALLFPDEHAPWIAAGLAVARRRLRPGDLDVVVGSTPPFSSAVLAMAIARALEVPYVVDVRDPFSLNAVWPPGKLDAAPRRALERWVLAGAHRVVTVSEGFARKQASLTETPIDVLPNAFDPEDLPEGSPGPLDEGVVLVHTGTIYPHASRLEAFAEGLAAATHAGLQVRLINCGRSGGVLKGALAPRGLEDLVDDRGTVSKEEAARLRGQAHGLLVFFPSRPDDDGHIPAKLFDYLAARKPILAVGDPNCEPAQLLRRYGHDDACGAADEVATWLRDRPGEGLAPEGAEQALSAAAMAGRYSRILDDVLADILDDAADSRSYQG